MTGYRLGALSRARLDGVHPDLVRVVERAIAISKIDFRVQEGRRTVARQRQLVREGKSQTMRSRHLTGHAVDVVALIDGAVNWDMENYRKIAAAMASAAALIGVPIEWGGNWTSLRDGPHFQLPWKKYP